MFNRLKNICQSVMSEVVINQNHNLDDKLSSTETTADLNSEIKDNGAQEVEESSPNKKIKLSNDLKDEPILKPTPPTQGRGRPSKDKLAKRLNILEKTAKEGEALLQNLGHKDDDPEGTRRRTRSQTRGTPPAAAAPKPKSTPKTIPKTTPQKDNSSPGAPKRRGRPPKNSISNNSVEEKTEVKTNSETKNELNESQEKKVNNSNETNNSNDVNPSEQSSNSNDSEMELPAEEVKPVEPVANDLTTTETNTKANSISGDSSNSVPVINTKPTEPTTD